MWKVTQQVATLSPHALTIIIQAVSHLLIDNYTLSLWTAAEHLNIGKNTVYMIVKQNFRKRKVADDGGGGDRKSCNSVLTGHGALCTILMTHHGEWEKFCQNWNRCGSKNLGRRQCFVDTVSSTENSFQRAKPLKQCYQKCYSTPLKKNELSYADPDPINNSFLNNNSPSCNVAIMGSFLLTGWFPSFVTHPICLTLLQLTPVSSLNTDLTWKVCIYSS